MVKNMFRRRVPTSQKHESDVGVRWPSGWWMVPGMVGGAMLWVLILFLIW